MIRCDYVSAPATPSSSNGAWMKKHQSVSSEIIPEIDPTRQKSGKIVTHRIIFHGFPTAIIFFAL